MRNTSYRYWMIYVIAIVAAMGGLLFGFDTGVISGAIPFFQKDFGIDDSMVEVGMGSGHLSFDRRPFIPGGGYRDIFFCGASLYRRSFSGEITGDVCRHVPIDDYDRASGILSFGFVFCG